MRTAYGRVQSFLRRDPMRLLRLFFLLALLLTVVAASLQVAHMGIGVTATLVCVAVQAAGFGLRLVELRRVRPVPLAVDVLELAGVLAMLALVTTVTTIISTFFMTLLFRAAVGPLRRLLLSLAGYLVVWGAAATVFPRVVVVPGAMISLPVTALLVYGTRTLMLRVQDHQRAQATLLDGVLRELPFPVVVADARADVVLANDAAIDLTGWVGATPLDLGGLDVRDLEDEPVALRDLVRAAATAKTEREVRLTRADGSRRHVRLQAVPIHRGAGPGPAGHGVAGQGSGVVLALLDVTAQRTYERRLHRAAYFDMLTGLPNRRMLWEQVNLAQGTGVPYAVLLIDLDDFKAVNDTLGHRIGDELLAGTAERIRCAVDGRATVARLGGDEFAVLIPQASAAEAEAAARAVRDSFAAPLDLSCGPVPGKGSVGLAVAEPGETPEQVIAKADAAMYREKSVRRRRSARRTRAATVRSAHSPVS
jgi:diguanylate cyclase (GGDEF)-like protein/PAS domain S-box-containing protein